jgi:O-antigen/teichoic acid export membrane protein
MNGSNRIVLNTLASYGQSLCGLVFALFSARWLLMALGRVDYGLFGVVGSTILLMTILTGGLSVGISRFYAYSIGEAEKWSKRQANDELIRWFNAALSIHIVIPILVLLVGIPLGEHAIANWLTIPEARLEACIWVFRASMVATLASVFSVPFVAMFSAHQKIYIVSVFKLFRSAATFIIAWCMLNAEGDRLIAYAVAMACVGIFIQFVLVFWAFVSFAGCRIRIGYLFSWERIRRLFSFTAWKMYGMSCVAFRDQGIPIVVNLHFGPATNAAYMVAKSLSLQAVALSTSLNRAFQPAVVTAEGSGDRELMLDMGMRVCKFGAILVIIFAIPAILLMRDLLQLWLVEPPEHAAEICQWMLSMLVVERLTGGQMLAVNAYGKIALYEMINGTLLFSAVPLMWMLFKIGLGPVSVGYALFVTMVIYCGSRIFFAKQLTGFLFLPWLKLVALPMAGVILLSVLVGEAFQLYFEAGLLRLLCISAAIGLTALLASWIILLADEEKAYLRKLPKRLLRT